MSDFLDKTLRDINTYIMQSVYSELYASKAGLLQAIDPRVKLLAILGFIIIVVSVSNIPVMLLLLSISTALAILSRISFRFYITRVVMFIPLFTGIIAIPAVFNTVTPGKEVFVVLTWPWHLAITKEGLYAAFILVLRVTTAVSFAILLTLTTRWNRLLQGLNAMKVPGIFILTLAMTYRYIFLLLDLSNKMLLARKSRAMGRMQAKKSWRAYAPVVGALFIKAYDMNEKVYLAMLARGFDGSVRSVKSDGMDYRTIAFAIAVVIIYIVLVVMAVVKADVVPWDL